MGDHADVVVYQSLKSRHMPRVNGSSIIWDIRLYPNYERKGYGARGEFTIMLDGHIFADTYGYDGYYEASLLEYQTTAPPMSIEWWDVILRVLLQKLRIVSGHTGRRE